ncbi:hypothetical protein [Chitinasiproducens palmae]|uniref:Uncharacterized protein n=1 Tax=Chitinasiproducens palmae TaxID=1770053 RepID=A0A1H2PVH5_9BURK|nr:hypothetical protein [Chitinasiproducens palmae]SDV51325.1 hypothetical protein SAMN05216551_11671 [Chitinasiproducens palmae]
MTRSCQRGPALRLRAPLSLSRVGGVLVCASLGLTVAVPTGWLTERVHRSLRGEPMTGLRTAVTPRGSQAARARAEAARAALPALRVRLLALRTGDDSQADIAEAALAPAWFAYLELAAHVSDVCITTLEQRADASPAADRSSSGSRDIGALDPGFELAGTGSFASIRRLAQLLADAAPGLSIVSLSIGTEDSRRTFDAQLRATHVAPPLAALDGVNGADGSVARVVAADPFAGHGAADAIVGTVELGGRHANVAADGRLIDLEDRTHD